MDTEWAEDASADADEKAEAEDASEETTRELSHAAAQLLAAEPAPAAGVRRAATRVLQRRPRVPARVAVAQVAVSDGVWVLDALAADHATGALLQWALACDDVAVLGFAFQGDLAMLRPLCGGELSATSSLIDVQALATRLGEDTPSLRRVCARALRVRLDKAQQCSNRARRPLEREQFTYAALDAHILLQVYEVICGPQ